MRPDQAEAFSNIKKLLTTFSTPLKFEAEKKQCITADVSKHSLGAGSLQKEEIGWLPVSYA